MVLVYSPAPRQVREWTMDLPDGCRLQQALESCSFFAEFPELKNAPLMLGIWSKSANANHLLVENDRIEIYRQLRVDPKIARRERFSRQGVKRAGLFSSTRAGAKAGY
ncbi:MAG: RnfH family protein [Pseudomonadota bacterium]